MFDDEYRFSFGPGYTSLHNDGRKMESEGNKEKTKKSPFLEKLPHRKVHRRLSEEWEGGACM